MSATFQILLVYTEVLHLSGMSKIAFLDSSYILKGMKFPLICCAIFMPLCLPLGLSAQSEEDQGTAPPPPPPPPARMDKGPGNPDGPGPGGRRQGMDRGNRGDRDLFKNLTDEEKKQVREAFDKVWSQPEIIEAREKMMKTNDEFRNLIQETLRRIDPAAAEILKRNKPPGGEPDHDRNRDRGHGGPPGGRGPGLPPGDDPDFVSKVVRRLAPFRHYSKEWNDLADSLHQQIMGKEEVALALKELEAAPPEIKVVAWKKLEAAYLKAVEQLKLPQGAASPSSQDAP